MDRRLLMGGVVIAAVLAGCAEDVKTNQPVQDRVALESFGNCGELETYLEDTAVRDMRTSMEQMKESPYWWGWGGGPVAMEDSAGGTPRANGPSAYTTTNTQVSGVDEADFVKNDGTRIFVLSGNKLYINQSWPADQLRTVGKLEIEGYPREMYLDGDHVVVFSAVYTPMTDVAPRGGGMAMACLDSFDCGYSMSNTLKVTVVDVSTLSAPRVAGEVFLPGYYVNSRKVGSSVRLVSSDAFRWPAEMKWYPEYQDGLYEDRARWAAAIDQLIEQNTRLIRESTLERWLPVSRYRGADGVMHDLTYDCSEFSRTNAPTRLGMVSLATLNVSPEAMASNNGPSLKRVSIVAEPGEIYASETSLYVTSGHWWWWPEPGQSDHTYVHKFDISTPNQAVYVASGGVSGHIVDQFSMDEHEGYLRIATTTTTRVPDEANPENWWGTFENTNRLTVLGQDGAALTKVGESPPIAPGERIMSARFVGTKGYVTTFLVVDPLFTFDLSDPTDPRPVGELEIPGFSTYIHPLGDNHLLTIGVDSGGGGGGWCCSSTLQLSIFDVTDFANPTRTFTQTVGTAWGWSEAMWDHKAFNYFPERGLLAIPFADWNSSATSEGEYWSSFVSDLRVFEVSTATGFTPKGALGMNDVYQSYTYEWGTERWTYYWSPQIRRSVMADNFVYAISDAGIRVADVSSLTTPIATTLFDKYQLVR